MAGPATENATLPPRISTNLTAEAAKSRKLVWERKLTSASKHKKELLRKRKREESSSSSSSSSDSSSSSESEEEEDEEDEEEKAKPKSKRKPKAKSKKKNRKPKPKSKMESLPWSSGEIGEGAVFKDNVVWSSTDDGFPLCTFASFGTESREDGSIAMNLTSSDDEVRVFKSSEELQASLVATLDALAAAIAEKRAEIVCGGMHPKPHLLYVLLF
jgi:hypothetical protein